MINIASWNIRGLNASIKQARVRDFIRNNSVSLCAILETLVKSETLLEVCARTFGRFEWVSNQMQSTNGTRIILAWDVRIMDVVVLEVHNQYLHCEIHIRNFSTPIFMSLFMGRVKRMLEENYGLVYENSKFS